jgi:hypothetical protein
LVVCISALLHYLPFWFEVLHPEKPFFLKKSNQGSADGKLNPMNRSIAEAHYRVIAPECS